MEKAFGMRIRNNIMRVNFKRILSMDMANSFIGMGISMKDNSLKDLKLKEFIKKYLLVNK